jgi:hypothetical protein
LPFIWLFWGIPTHADWSIARLQAEARSHTYPHAAATEADATSGAETSDLEERIIVRYPYTDSLFKVTSRTVSFDPGSSSSSADDGPAWTVLLDELTALHKVEKKTRRKEMEDLAIVTRNRGTWTVHDLDPLRDEIFSQIVGYSRLRWRKIE